MPRLRRVSVTEPGWTRRRAGRGFVYRDAAGEPLRDADLVRAKELVIPPAWKDVWICPRPNGHLQASGIDEAGRRQYLYHPVWVEQRAREKFDRAGELGAVMDRLRARVKRDLSGGDLTEASVAALAVRLLDLGAFRIGSDVYSQQHGSAGLTTLERRHVQRDGAGLLFSFTGKSGVDQRIRIQDPQAVRALEAMRRRRGGEFDQLLAFRDEGEWRRARADDVNDYLRRATGLEVSAKDFRTWHGTVTAAVALGGTGAVPSSRTAREKVRRAAVEQVAEFLGNTPTVARTSYVDPRVFDLHDSGRVITVPQGRTGSWAWRGRVEAEVVRLLELS